MAIQKEWNVRCRTMQLPFSYNNPVQFSMNYSRGLLTKCWVNISHILNITRHLESTFVEKGFQNVDFRAPALRKTCQLSQIRKPTQCRLTSTNLNCSQETFQRCFHPDHEVCLIIAITILMGLSKTANDFWHEQLSTGTPGRLLSDDKSRRRIRQFRCHFDRKVLEGCPWRFIYICLRISVQQKLHISSNSITTCSLQRGTQQVQKLCL